MIKFSATNALVHLVSAVIQVSDRFQKRGLIIDDSWDKDGVHYTNFVLIEFSGDKMAQLDSVYPGQRINVDGMLTGREYNGRIYNTVRGLSVTPYQAQPQYAPSPAPMPGGYPSQQYQAAPGYPSPAPMPGGYPQPQQPQYPQQPQQPQQPQYQQQPQYPAQPQYRQPTSPGADDLPFD